MRRDVKGFACCSVCVVCLVMAGSSPACGEPRDLSGRAKTDVLEMLVREGESNYGRMRTWRGTMQYEELQYYRGRNAVTLKEVLGIDTAVSMGDVERRSSGSISFAVDCERDSFYTNFVQSTEGMSDIELGKPYERSDTATLFEQASVVTPTQFLHFSRNLIHGPPREIPHSRRVNRHTAFIDPAPKAKKYKAWSHVVDPRLFFSSNGEESYWELLDRCLEQYEELPEGYLTVAEHQEADHISYRITVRSETSSGMGVSLEYLFDERVGFNVTGVTEKYAGQLRIQQDIDYSLVADMWLPTTVSRSSWDPSGKIELRRSVAFQESVLNEDIPEDTFTYRVFGLQDGDRMVDRIKLVEYFIKDGEPVKEDFDFEIDDMLADAEAVVKDVQDQLGLNAEDASRRSGPPVVARQGNDDNLRDGPSNQDTPTAMTVGTAIVIIVLCCLGVIIGRIIVGRRRGRQELGD